MGWQCSESGIIQSELKKASQIPCSTTCCVCVSTHLTSPGCPLLAISTEAQEEEYLEKALDTLQGFCHCKHKKLGFVFLEGKGCTFQGHCQAHTRGFVPQFCERTSLYYSAHQHSNRLCFFWLPNQVSIERLALVGLRKIFISPCRLFISWQHL